MGRVLQGMALLLSWLIVGDARTAEPVDLVPFLRDDMFEMLKVSPDGRHIAATVPEADRTRLVIIERDGGRTVMSAAGRARSVVADFWWVADDRVVLAIGETEGTRDQPWLTGELHGIALGDTRPRVLFGENSALGQSTRLGSADYRQMAVLVDTLPEDPDHVLIGTWSAEATPRTRVVRMNVHNGGLRTIAEAPLRRSQFTVDGAGVVRFADGADDRNIRKLYYRAHDRAPWELVNDQAASGIIMAPLGFSAGGAVAYLQVTRQQGPDAIEAWDTATRQRRVVLHDPTVDPLDIVYDADGRTPIGASYMSDGVVLRFFDEEHPLAKVYRAIERAMPGLAVSITSFTRDQKHALVRVAGDREPGRYLLADFAQPGLEPVFTRRAWMPRERMAPTRAVRLEARDGVALHGYLTSPVAVPLDRLPTVVLPHGGPYGVFDRWEFDEETQLLAAAGYAVLRVNFRGSGNHGQAFQRLGAREWGGTMQDDITDATRWMIEQQLADPERICIYGASYGAYAALMGVAREPALYRCAIGYVGVYDLPRRLRDTTRFAEWLKQWSIEWMGERGTLAERSPVNLADRIQVPVYLAAGGADTRAPIAHTRDMERALRRHGVDVETLYYPSEGHGFVTRAHREAYYRQLLAFLSKHLGGAAAR